MNFWKTYLSHLKTLIKRNILGIDGIGNTLCLRKTLWMNFKCLKFSTAKAFPIWVYRHTKLNSLGSIVIDCDKIESGMIKIGSFGNAGRLSTIIENHGCITFKGSTSIFRGCYIHNTGNITFDGQNRLSESCTLKITEYLHMGKMSRFGSETYAIDTDFHFAIDVNTGNIKRNSKGISIGEYNWFGTKSFIKKGTKTGFGFVIAAPNTVLTKDYSTLENYTILGGNPAKPIGQGLLRIFNTSEEQQLLSYFKSHLKEHTITKDISDLNMFDFCGNGEILK